MLHISGSIHHMIFMYGTHVQNYSISRCFFNFFKILIFWGVRGLKGQKIIQNDKKSCLLCSITQEPYIIWLSFVGHKCKMISLGIFFHFFKILIFQVDNGVKGQKIAQNDKKFCLSYLVSQKPYIIWLSFVVHKCKMISPGIFSFFQNFEFLGC